MDIPWGCKTCGHENLIDLDRLSGWPLDKIVTAQGFICEKCGSREAIFYTTVSLEEAMSKLMRYPLAHDQFRYHFVKTLRKAKGINERAEKQWREQKRPLG